MTPWWVAPAAVVAAAAISALALVIVRKLKGPVTIQDLWAENRQLRTDLNAVSAKVETLIQVRATERAESRIVGEGFDALSAAVDRDSEARGTAPLFTPRERAAIDAARRVRADDTVWNTTPLHAPEA